jgi:hypothetical protein
MVFIFIFSSIHILQPKGSLTLTVEASSIWIQTTKKDFNLGTYNGICLIEKDEEAYLKLEPLGAGTWEELETTGNPQGRTYFDMASVDGTKNTVLFGGRSDYELLNDTWIFDYSTKTWTNQKPIIHPIARTNHKMSSIYGSDNVLLFGGQDHPDYFNDTWIFDLSEHSWINMTPNPCPKGRDLHAMAGIYGTDKVLLYGGNRNGYQPTDTWVYDLSNNTWTEKTPASNPGGVNSHSMASIHGTDKVVLFGAIGADRQTWVYDLSDNYWTRKMPNSKPSDRRDFAMASIDGTDVIMLFGGYSSNFNYLSDTWIYDLSDNIWILKTPENKPSSRENHGLVPIYGTDHILLFGGDRYGYHQDTWIFKGKLSGNFVSTIYDTEAISNFNKLNWEVELSINTSIKFQLRSSSIGTDMDTKDFVGPNGLSDSFYTISGTDIWQGHDAGRWVQYKAYFESLNIELSPILKNVSIIYNKMPVVNSLNPVDGWLTNNNRPIFEWAIDDLDFDEQTGFQVLIDDNSDFKNINYDSGEHQSSQQKWQFPKGTKYDNIQDGTWFWKVRIKDDEDDWSEYCTPKKLIIDTKPPNSQIINQSKNGYHNISFSISGSSSDTIAGSGVSKVELRINRVFDSFNWDGENWIESEAWIVISGTKDWIFNSSSVTWSSGAMYSIQARAKDNANNVENPTNGYSFIIDDQSPSTKIIIPQNNSFQNYFEQITGNCTDPGNSGIKRVEISIIRVFDNFYWDGISWSSKVHWFNIVGNNNWTFNTRTISWSGGEQYLIQTHGIDNVGNIEFPGDINIFTYDNIPPEELAILINDGNKFTNSTIVDLKLFAEDLHSRISKMAFSIDNNNMSSWEDYNTTKSFKISDLEGQKNLIFFVKDNVGNTAEKNSSIIYDTTPPYSLSIKINNDTDYTNSRSIVLKLNALDNLSGISKMSFSNDGKIWSNWQKYTNKKSYQLSSGYGSKKVYFRVKDQAGNIAPAVFEKILFNRTSQVEPDKQERDDDGNNVGYYFLAIMIFMVIIIILIYITIKKNDKLKKQKTHENNIDKPESKMILKKNQKENKEK